MIRFTLALGLISIMLAALSGCGPAAPVAGFVAVPLTAYAPEEVQFSDLSEGNVSSWAWDFDSDGLIDSALQNPKHVYTNPGNYTVSLTVVGPGGKVLAPRVLYHPHVTAQPFTRSLSGVKLPASVTEVTVRAGDTVHGLGGREVKVKISHN